MIGRVWTRTFAPKRRAHTLLQRVFDVIRPNDTSLSQNSVSLVGLCGTRRLHRPEDFDQWTEDAMRESREIVAQISSFKAGSHHLDSTIRDMDRLSDTICQVIDTAELVRNVHPDPRWTMAADRSFQKLANFMSVLNTKTELYEAVCEFLKQKRGRGEEDELLVARMFAEDFQRSGIHLSPATRGKFIEMQDKMNHLSHQFTQAESGGLDRNLVLEQLLYWRSKLAALLGHDSYASYFLQDKMARNPQTVMQFLNKKNEMNRPMAEQSANLIRQLKYKNRASSQMPVCMLDRNLYGTGGQKHISEISNYLSLGTVVQGISDLLSHFYGVRLEPVTTAADETWNPSVRRLDVIHETDGKIATIYCDLFQRLSGKGMTPKCPIAAQFTVRCSRRIDWDHDKPTNLDSSDTFYDRSKRALYQLPIVVLTCSFKYPTAGRPTLLTWSEAETLFHEFGHAIHSALGRSNFQHVAGTRCKLDIAETPSILMEYLIRHPSVLSRFRHYQTNNPMPKELVEKHLSSLNGPRSFRAIDVQQQIFFATVDQTFHNMNIEQLENKGNYALPIYRDTYRKIHVLSADLDQSQPKDFTHLAVYGSGYYSYLWSRSIAHDLFKHLFEPSLNNGQADLMRRNGEIFYNEFLRHGGGKDPWDIRWDLMMNGRPLNLP